MKLKLAYHIFLFLIIMFIGCEQRDKPVNNKTLSLYSETFTIQKNVLADKIKGGWAGQVIGCTYGGPTEFQYCGTMIQDYTPIPWDESRMLWYFENLPGLYDDIYMDLTFVEVFEKEGLDAPVILHAKAFAHAEYKLWHANQAARYNILNGMEPPATGFWENNPHSDDIDFQIEADFAGLMSPGMVNTASDTCDKIGHIMNYGDGWYGGVYVAAMYSLAFISNDIEFIVKEGLKTIPQESDFYQCIADVINWHRKYPNDWKSTWFECEKKWSSDIGCPSGVFTSFNIDAKLNAAYIIIGLLYGEGDYGKTIDISTRCGQDSDCNPASAAGILGVMMGYSKIPDYWKQGIDKVEDIDFKYTDISLNDVYKMGFDHALQNIERNGGSIGISSITLKSQKPLAVIYEKGFKDHYPVELRDIDQNHRILDEINPTFSFEFNGNSFVVKGKSKAIPGANPNEQENPTIEVYIDNVLYETVNLPTDFTTRRPEICWKYNLKPEKHSVEIKLLNPSKNYQIQLYNILIYNDKP